MSARTLLVSILSLGLTAAPNGEDARLLRQPSISSDHLAFVYANDVWVVDRAGGDARRLTTFPGSESNPQFSPDGQRVAFSGQHDGNTDVYVVSLAGGEPTRLTWHPSADVVRGWSADGARVIFASGRTGAPVSYAKFWSPRVHVRGGWDGWDGSGRLAGCGGREHSRGEVCAVLRRIGRMGGSRGLPAHPAIRPIRRNTASRYPHGAPSATSPDQPTSALPSAASAE